MIQTSSRFDRLCKLAEPRPHVNTCDTSKLGLVFAPQLESPGCPAPPVEDGLVAQPSKHMHVSIHDCDKNALPYPGILVGSDEVVLKLTCPLLPSSEAYLTVPTSSLFPSKINLNSRTPDINHIISQNTLTMAAPASKNIGDLTGKWALVSLLQSPPTQHVRQPFNPLRFTNRLPRTKPTQTP